MSRLTIAGLREDWEDLAIFCALLRLLENHRKYFRVLVLHIMVSYLDIQKGKWVNSVCERETDRAKERERARIPGRHFLSSSGAVEPTIAMDVY